MALNGPRERSDKGQNSGPAEQCLETARCLPMHGRRRVTVEVGRDRYRRVAEHLPDELRIDALAEQASRPGMSSVERAHRWDPIALPMNVASCSQGAP